MFYHHQPRTRRQTKWGVRKGLSGLRSEIVSQEKNIVTIKAEFDADAVQKAVNETLRELSKKINLKGFRKGHVPRKILELHIGRSGLYQETLESLLSQAMEQLVEDYDLELITEPKIQISDPLEEGKPFTAEFTFEVRPEVELPDLSQIQVERPLFEIDEALVDANIQRLLEMHAELKDVEGRSAQPTDSVVADFSSFVLESDGTATELDKAQKTLLDLSMETLRQEIKEALVGKEVGAFESIEVPIAEDYRDPKLAGKTVRYDIKIEGIKEKIIPELTDELAEKITGGKAKTVEELRKYVREQLEASAKRRSEEIARENAIEKLCELSKVEIPETLVDRQSEALRKNMTERIQKEYNLSFEDYLKEFGLEAEKIDEEIRERAKKMVLRSLVLEALGDREAIEPTPEELSAEMDGLAASMGVEAERLKSFLLSDQNRLSELAYRVRDKKIVDYLMSQVQIVEVPAEKLQGEPQESKTETEKEQENEPELKLE